MNPPGMVLLSVALAIGAVYGLPIFLCPIRWGRVFGWKAPDDLRLTRYFGRCLGALILMQCGFGVGFFLASLAWLFISPIGPDAWRVMFLLGVAPALLTLWIRRAIPESDKWERVNERRAAATERKRSGAALSGQEESLARFTMLDLFAEPEIRRRVILTFLMSLASTFAFWGISAWMPPYTASVAAKAGLPAQQWASYVAMAVNGAAIVGYAGFGFLADVFGRKPITMAYFALAFLSVPMFFMKMRLTAPARIR